MYRAIFLILVFNAFVAVRECATAQEVVEPSFYAGVGWLMEPVPDDSDQSVRSTQVGQFLFAQGFRSAGEASLTQDFSIETPYPASLASGSRVRQVAGPTLDARTFCTASLTYDGRGNILDGQRLRVCFLDRERDGSFDRVFWAGTATSGFTPFFLSSPSPALVSYETRRNDDVLLVAGLVVSRRIGGYRIQFAVQRTDGPLVLDSQFIVRDGAVRPAPGSLDFRARNLPLTLSMSGASIEILGVSNDIVTYRVVSQFGRDFIAIPYGGLLGSPELQPAP